MHIYGMAYNSMQHDSFTMRTKSLTASKGINFADNGTTSANETASVQSVISRNTNPVEKLMPSGCTQDATDLPPTITHML